MSSVERAAGGLVWREGDHGVDVLVVHRPRYDDWAFPKGKLDDGESLIECAAREVREETGFRCTVGRYLGTTSFTKPSGKFKETAYWAMEVAGGKFVPNKEVDEIKWVPAEALSDVLDYAIDVDFVHALSEDWRAPADRILLVRHAHAGDRHRWTGGEDAHRPLSKRGKRESKRIAKLLRMFAIDRILTSPAERCTATVAPLAEARALHHEIHPDLWEAAAEEAIASVIKSASVGTNVVCTHGPVVATTLHLLAGASRGVPMEKGSTWVFDLADGELVAANYIATPRV